MSWLNPFADDEKLGKKHDDHRPNSHMQPGSWPARKPAQAMRRRRILYILCGALFVFLFIKNIPTDIGPHPRWADTRTYHGPVSEGKVSAPSSASSSPVAPSKKPPRPALPSEAEEHYHDGPIKFYKLAASLHAVAKLGGQKDVNKNVLFAAANLKSVSELLPLACEMARWDRNDVHLALMGRDDMEIQEIQSLNGVAEEDCNVHWHDARPDFSKWSTDFRMESSVAASLEHIQTFIHPQVILIHDSKKEDEYLVNAIREKALDLFKPLIELPSNAIENLSWITRLDSASLAAWPKVYIDILIQAPSGSSGSMVRLLKSIENADYFGARRPHLTIELPAVVDEPTAGFLDYFMWPPVDWSGAPHISQVTLRHRVPRKTSTVEEASARLVESFWPKRSTDSHLLLLSPQVELSPLYFHYLFYSILEYRYSSFAKTNEKYRNLMGISLHLPESYLNDPTTFTPPRLRQLKHKADSYPGSHTPFLWQAPNNNAALYFGDRWMEFHSFLSLRLTKPPSKAAKMVSKGHPAWMESLLEIMRARGYSLLYPGAFFNDFTISTVHDELYQVPEEFAKRAEPPQSPSPDSLPDKPLEGNANTTIRAPPNTEKPVLEGSLVELLANKGDLLEVDKMPYLSHDGNTLSFKEASEAALSFSEEFRRTTGDCVSGHEPPKYVLFQAVDLFCDPNEPFDYHKAEGPPLADSTSHESKAQPEEPLPHDPDQISAVEAEKAKHEVAHHLDRQAGDEAEKSRGKSNEKAEKPTEVETYRQKMLKEQGGAKDEKQKQTSLDYEDEKRRVASAKKKLEEVNDITAGKPNKQSAGQATGGEDSKDPKAPKPIANVEKTSQDEKLKTPGEEEDEDGNRSPGW